MKPERPRHCNRDETASAAVVSDDTARRCGSRMNESQETELTGMYDDSARA